MTTDRQSTDRAHRAGPTPVAGPESRARASRQNGARSQGPRTAGGKARSARNALTHGLRARKLILLDDENLGKIG